MFPEVLVFVTLPRQVYLQLTLEALEKPSGRVGQEDGADVELDGTHHDDGGGGNNAGDGRGSISNIRLSSPESLLSSAELYTDQALAAGSGLPLARLVKGQALALRGQHQVNMLLLSPTIFSSSLPLHPFFYRYPSSLFRNVPVNGILHVYAIIRPLLEVP